MPLGHYGVCIGTFAGLQHDEQGNWYHGVFNVNAGGQTYKCTVDLESQNQVEVEYQVIPALRRDLFGNVMALADGYHELARTPTSGAIDYVRSPLLTGQGCATVWWGLWNAVFRTNLPWKTASGQQAVTAMQAELTDPAVRRVYCFGEPFTTGFGMHNVHMNQGDPPLSPDGRDHQGDDAIWQDGGTLLEHADGTLKAFLSKFSSQSLRTDNAGLPL
jgi:hypothetical protein